MRHDARMLLADLVAVSATVAATRSRTAKVQAVAGALRGTAPGEAPAVVAFLSGELRQRQIGVGWSSLKDAPEPAATASLTVAEVDDAFGRIGALAGPGSQAARREALGALFARATEEEATFLRRLLLGDLRQGALEGVVVAAVAAAADVPVDAARRAHMLDGDLGDVARIALAEGAGGLARIGLVVGRPIHPMLAQPADDLAAALDAHLPRRRRGEARRRPHPGAPLGGRRRAVHPHARRRHRPAARARGGGARAARRRVRPRRRGDRPAPGRPAAAVPGHRVAARQPHRRRAAARDDAADAPALRPAAPGGRGPARPSRQRALGAARRARRARRACATDRRRRSGGRPGGVRRRARRRSRGRGREGARRALRRRPQRRRVDEGQAAPHARPRRPRRGVGPRAPARAAEQPAPRGARTRRRVRDARQDLQGAHRRDARVADRAPAAARRVTGPARRARPPGARRRDRVRRRPDEPALSRAASRCASRESCSTGPTSRRARRAPWRRCSPSTPARRA